MRVRRIPLSPPAIIFVLWVAQEISRTQGIDQERVDLNQPFAAYGLDSLAASEFAHKLQAEFQVQVDVAEFFSDSTISEVIRRATKNTQSPLRKVEKEKSATYPLSYGQRALWFVHQTAPENAAYNKAEVFSSISVPGYHFIMLSRPNVRIIAETLQHYLSMNSYNELRAVSPEMRFREFIGLESQHTS